MNDSNRNPAIDEPGADAEAQPATPAARSPLADLRALIAGGLAAEFLAATPRVRAAFHSQLNSCNDTAERDVLRFAWNALSTRQDQLATQFDRCLRKRFDEKLDGPDDALSHSGQFSIAAVAMMEELGMQDDLELEQCVDQLREHCDAELALLAANLRKVLGCSSMPEARNPAFPRVLLRALLDALASIGCNVRTRQAALHACGPLLSNIIKDIYMRANAMLAGVERHGETQLAA